MFHIYLLQSYTSFLDTVSSDSLDIRTMMVLMKCLKDIDIIDVLPMNYSNTDISADLSRIWWYRREVIHCKKFTMKQFEDRWYNISEVRFYFK